ncbi:hypothetical protein CsatB_001052 [Cannabis sativa]
MNPPKLLLESMAAISFKKAAFCCDSVMATAQVLFHRFYCKKSFARFNVKVSSSKKTEKGGKNRRPVGHSSTMDYLSSSTPYDYSRNYDTITRLPNSSISYDSFADATSEKESGNEYFKQKKFKEAIDCYLELEALHYLKQQ